MGKLKNKILVEEKYEKLEKGGEIRKILIEYKYLGNLYWRIRTLKNLKIFMENR